MVESFRPSSTLQFFLRCGLTVGSLFVGSSFMHILLKPDLNIPTLRPPAPIEPIEGFLPSSTWDGRREGMAFKSGPNGVGYYPDR
jgi:hypothetical protein